VDLRLHLRALSPGSSLRLRPFDHHPYQDGNKRIAFLAMVVFLGLNGWDFAAPEVEVVATMLAVASGQCSEPELAEWLRKYMVTES
jgi:death-on-curing family protein